MSPYRFNFSLGEIPGHVCASSAKLISSFRPYEIANLAIQRHDLILQRLLRFSGDFARQWHAQLVLLNLAPAFAGDRILALADRTDLGQEAMAALRKLGTKRAIRKLEATAFEKPGRNDQREGVRQAALTHIKYIDDQSLLPNLFEITSEDRWQTIRWAARSAAARIGHGDAVPVIRGMLTSPDPYIAFAGAEAPGDTSSRDAVPVLTSAIPSALEGNKLSAIIEALTSADTPNDTRQSCRPCGHLSEVE